MHQDAIVCPHCESGRIGIHARTERRNKCHRCGKTFAETVGTPLYGLKSRLGVVTRGLALLSRSCPVQAIVFALDERTVRDWQMKAGQYARRVQVAYTGHKQQSCVTARSNWDKCKPTRCG
ncbi:MAG: hypothetical protein KatS3mg053_1246 [Candidatus Roseilinea sp.]|nr:MAG: hypothetical protein KatS3mg053_1246 [Candidatus Roseilinea sp.]